MHPQEKGRKFAIVLSGGGARGAYEAGVIHYIRTQLPEKARYTPFPIYCGASVGAVNACVMASFHTNPLVQGQAVRHAWETLRQEDVYKRSVSAFSRFFLRSTLGISTNFFKKMEDGDERSHFVGFVDTAPFREYLKKNIDWAQLNGNISMGRVLGVALAATNMSSGQMTLFLQKWKQWEYRGIFPIREVTLDWRHVMASSAIPILFPPIEIEGTYFADGGLRLNTPLAPAIHMGADKIFVIGMHAQSEADTSLARGAAATIAPPTLGDTIGKILNSIFVDKLDYDLKHMERINALIEAGEQVFGADFIHKINAEMISHYERNGIRQHILKRRHIFSLFPSQDVRAIFGDCMQSASKKKSFTMAEKILFKVLDVDSVRGQEFLSYFLFLPDYLHAMIQLGYQDAHNHRDEIIQFLLY